MNLSGSNIMQVLYLVNKCMVPSLAEKCSEYLRDNLTASNAFSILTLAHKFEEKNLEDRCWKAGSGWYHSGAYSVNFIINKPLKLLRVEQFGSEDGEYTVSTKVKDTVHNSCLEKVSLTYTSVKDETDIYFGFDVIFNRPVCLEGNKQYTLVSVVKGPVSWCGEEGQLFVESGGVQFTFSKCTFKNDQLLQASFQPVSSEGLGLTIWVDEGSRGFTWFSGG